MNFEEGLEMGDTAVAVAVERRALAAKLAKQVEHEFEYVIWRSLLHAPPIETLFS